MEFDEIMTFLESHGNENAKKTYIKHGAREPLFGVRVSDLKTIVKKVKKNYELSMLLYDTGNSDAMYLAGLIGDETKMTKEDLNNWVNKAYWYYLCEFAVPFVAQESPFKYELALEWMASENEQIESAGWSTYTGIISLDDNDSLDYDKIISLMKYIEQNIHKSKNRVRYVMNQFIISVGAYVPELHELAKEAAVRIGKVHVDMGGTACKVPLATQYIQKIVDMDRVGRKRKASRC